MPKIGVTVNDIFARTVAAVGRIKWIDDNRMIATHYLKGWFTFDLITLLPSIFDIIPSSRYTK